MNKSSPNTLSNTIISSCTLTRSSSHFTSCSEQTYENKALTFGCIP